MDKLLLDVGLHLVLTDSEGLSSESCSLVNWHPICWFFILVLIRRKTRTRRPSAIPRSASCRNASAPRDTTKPSSSIPSMEDSPLIRLTIRGKTSILNSLAVVGLPYSARLAIQWLLVLTPLSCGLVEEFLFLPCNGSVLNQVPQGGVNILVKRKSVLNCIPICAAGS